MPHYRIRHGYSFRENDTTVKSGGQVIELGSDVAAQNAEKVDLMSADELAAHEAEQAEKAQASGE